MIVRCFKDVTYFINWTYKYLKMALTNQLTNETPNTAENTVEIRIFKITKLDMAIIWKSTKSRNSEADYYFFDIPHRSKIHTKLKSV